LLDDRWLALLHRDGLAPYLKKVPEPPADLRLAIEEFNRGEYWRCHETLEQVWLAERYPLRLFYHVLIKAAVGLLHLERHNRQGALAKLQDAEYALVPFLPRFMGVDTERLGRDVIERLAYLQTSGRVDWKVIERLTPVQIVSTS
jgi:hypothetical protein